MPIQSVRSGTYRAVHSRGAYFGSSGTYDVYSNTYLAVCDAAHMLHRE
jgi:hypothetical protein